MATATGASSDLQLLAFIEKDLKSRCDELAAIVDVPVQGQATYDATVKLILFRAICGVVQVVREVTVQEAHANYPHIADTIFEMLRMELMKTGAKVKK